MSEYHVICASTSKAFASFDRWSKNVIETWHALAKDRAVNLLCYWPCGCVRRALCEAKTTPPIARFVKGKIVKGRKKTVRVHAGWRRIEACAFHALPMGKRNAPENFALRTAYLASFPGQGGQRDALDGWAGDDISFDAAGPGAPETFDVRPNRG